MSEAWHTLLALVVWPGVLVAAPLGWLQLWFMRKLAARLQGRRGPPFFQPFFDFMKLLGKEMVIPTGGDAHRLPGAAAGLPCIRHGGAGHRAIAGQPDPLRCRAT